MAQDLVHCAPLPDWVDHPALSRGNPGHRDILYREWRMPLAQRCPGQSVFAGAGLALPRPPARSDTRGRAARRACRCGVGIPDTSGSKFILFASYAATSGSSMQVPEAFQLLRRETNMERLIFDGRLTA